MAVAVQTVALHLAQYRLARSTHWHNKPIGTINPQNGYQLRYPGCSPTPAERGRDGEQEVLMCCRFVSRANTTNETKNEELTTAA